MHRSSMNNGRFLPSTSTISIALAGQSLLHKPQLTHRLISKICFPLNPSAGSHFTNGYLPVAGLEIMLERTRRNIGDIRDFLLFAISITLRGRSSMLSQLSALEITQREATLFASLRVPLGRYVTSQKVRSCILRL